MKWSKISNYLIEKKLQNFSKNIGCNLLLSKKYFAHQELQFQETLTEFHECSRLCKDDVVKCSHGWNYDTSKKRAIFDIPMPMSITLVLQCYFAAGFNSTLEYNADWVLGNAACGVFESNMKKECFEV